MNWMQRGTAWGRRLIAELKKYKFVCLVAAVGVVLLLLPDLGTRREAAEEPPEESGALSAAADPFQVEEMESKLSQILSRIEGAGEVTVVLTVKSTARQVLAQDGESREREGDLESSLSTVVIDGEDGEQTVSLQQLSPQYQGALVVCSGGEDPGVRLRLVEAVSALTGLGADKISVCKGK